jgi:hypothetical protein
MPTRTTRSATRSFIMIHQCLRELAPRSSAQKEGPQQAGAYQDSVTMSRKIEPNRFNIPPPLRSAHPAIRSVSLGGGGRVTNKLYYGDEHIADLIDLGRVMSRDGPKLPPLVSPNRKAPRVETRTSHQKGSQGELL